MNFMIYWHQEVVVVIVDIHKMLWIKWNFEKAVNMKDEVLPLTANTLKMVCISYGIQM